MTDPVLSEEEIDVLLTRLCCNSDKCPNLDGNPESQGICGKWGFRHDIPKVLDEAAALLSKSICGRAGHQSR